MRDLFSLFVSAAAFALLASPCAHAATAEPALKAFLKTFAGAAERGDVATVAKLTAFPLKNAVHQEPESVSAAGFKKHFQINAYKELASCLKTTPPEPKGRSGDWGVNCDGNIFYFAKRGGDWRHTGFENINE